MYSFSEISKNKYKQYNTELEEKQEIYRKIQSQKEIYNCPSCKASLKLIEKKLILTQEIVLQNEIDEDNILNDINKKLNFSLKINPKNYNTNDIKITKKILQEIQQKYRELKSNDISKISLKNIMINIISETTIYKKIIKNTNFNIYKNLEQLK